MPVSTQRTAKPRPSRPRSAAGTGHFTPELFRFLRQLRRNNDREWFQANKQRYLEHVRDPMLRFISDFAPLLEKISPHFVADPRPVGGSMFRIHRDVRFSRDKSPYKTAATAQFRHAQGKDVHAPGYYLHLGTDGVRAGCGIWRPDSGALAAIRESIAEDPPAWKRAFHGKAFRKTWTPGGDSLKRPPRGFDPGHPMLEDLKRKDIVAFVEWSEADVVDPGFLRQFAGTCKSADPLMKYLTGVLDVEF